MKTILVPIDFSPATKSVITAACDLAKQLKGRLVLLHVVQPLPLVVNDVYALQMEQSEVMMNAAQEASASRLREAKAACAKKKVAARTVQALGLPAAEILSRAKSADYIVMGTHGHTAVFDLLVGGTAHAVLRKAPCPVVVIPPGKQR